jgi:hypothetical protein
MINLFHDIDLSSFDAGELRQMLATTSRKYNKRRFSAIYRQLRTLGVSADQIWSGLKDDREAMAE